MRFAHEDQLWHVTAEVAPEHLLLLSVYAYVQAEVTHFSKGKLRNRQQEPSIISS